MLDAGRNGLATNSSTLRKLVFTTIAQWRSSGISGSSSISTRHELPGNTSCVRAITCGSSIRTPSCSATVALSGHDRGIFRCAPADLADPTKHLHQHRAGAAGVGPVWRDSATGELTGIKTRGGGRGSRSHQDDEESFWRRLQSCEWTKTCRRFNIARRKQRKD